MSVLSQRIILFLPPLFWSVVLSKTFGDLSKVKQYQRKAQALNKRLEETGDKVEGFNREEDAFDWERTQYPNRLKALSTLAPYLKLYDAIVEFETKNE